MLPSGILKTRYGPDMAIIHTRTQWILLTAALAFLFTCQLWASPYWVSWMIRVCIVIVLLLGLHILTGLCGQFSVGQAAIMAVGAYTAAILHTSLHLSMWACLPLSGISAGVVGLFFGLPSLRVKGFYLAISTIAAQFLIMWAASYEEFARWTGGYQGLFVGDTLKLGSVDFNSDGVFYCLALGVVVVGTVVAKNIQRTATGRAFVAIRDNDLAAEVSGISLYRHKLLAFFIACVYAGVAGWLWVNAEGRVSPEQFRLWDSVWYIGMLIVGGMGSTTGVFFGALSIKLMEVVIDQITPILTRIMPSLAIQIHASLSWVVFGVVVLAFLILEPRGLYHLWEKIKRSYRMRPYSYTAAPSTYGRR